MELISLISFLIPALIAVLLIIAVFWVIKIFYDDQKYISKMESESFLKGMEMKEPEILRKIEELDKEQKEYKKRMGFGSSSLKIVGEKCGFKKALRTLQENREV